MLELAEPPELSGAAPSINCTAGLPDTRGAMQRTLARVSAGEPAAAAQPPAENAKGAQLADHWKVRAGVHAVPESLLYRSAPRGH